MPVKNQTADVVVLGAGIVGVSAAYAVRQRDLSVLLIDRREPGSGTSYGNAGILSSGSILPLNQPALWRALPSYLTRRCAGIRRGASGMSTGLSAPAPMRANHASG